MVRIHVLEETTVHIVSLLLDDGAKLHQLVGNGLVGTLEDVDETISRVSLFCVQLKRICVSKDYLRSRVRLVLDSEHGDGLASLAGSTSSSNAVDVILDSERELWESS